MGNENDMSSFWFECNGQRVPYGGVELVNAADFPDDTAPAFEPVCCELTFKTEPLGPLAWPQMLGIYRLIKKGTKLFGKIGGDAG